MHETLKTLLTHVLADTCSCRTCCSRNCLVCIDESSPCNKTSMYCDSVKNRQKGETQGIPPQR